VLVQLCTLLAAAGQLQQATDSKLSVALLWGIAQLLVGAAQCVANAKVPVEWLSLHPINKRVSRLGFSSFGHGLAVRILSCTQF
jgi:hypothetical protein